MPFMPLLASKLEEVIISPMQTLAYPISIKSPHEAQIRSMNSTQYESESMPKHHNLTHNVCKHSNLQKEKYI
jgi:hypothetical protein